jgi:hypothetical protein
VAGPSRLGRVIADLGAILMAVEQLEGGVDVEYPADHQGFAGTFGQRLIHPARGLGQPGFACRPLILRTAVQGRRQVLESAPQAFVADDLGHPQYPRRDAVAAQPGDVRVAPLTVQDRQQPGAQHILRLRCVRAGVVHRTAPDPAFEHSANFQKLGKKRQLAHRRGTSAFVPAYPVAPSRRHQAHLACRCAGHVAHRADYRRFHAIRLEFRLTHRVTLLIRLNPASDHGSQPLRGVQLRKIGSTRLRGRTLHQPRTADRAEQGAVLRDARTKLPGLA